MDLIIWLMTAISLLIGCWIQTALGFGLAVFAAPIIVMLKPEWVPVLLTSMALVISILNSWNQRAGIELKELRLAFFTRVPGTVLGAWLLVQMNTAWLQVTVALCVLMAVLISWLGKQFEYSPGRLGIAAFVSGIMGTTTSIGGPPMALVMQHGRPQTVRANLSLYFTYSCFLSLISYVWIGRIDVNILIDAGSFVPVCLLGFYWGIKARGYVDAGRFRPLLLWLCGGAGSVALIGALWKV